MEAPLSSRMLEPRVLRILFGVSAALAAAMMGNWLMAAVLPVFILLLVMMPSPLSISQACHISILGLGSLIVSIWLTLLIQYLPALGIILLTYFIYRALLGMVSGVHLFQFLMAIAGCVILPLLGLKSMSLVVPVAGALWINLLIAILFSWVAFAIWPAETTHVTSGRMESTPVTRRLALSVTLTIMPLILVHLLLGWGSILVMIFAAVIAIGTGGAHSWQACKAQVMRNCLGALIAIGTYHFVVIFNEFHLTLIVSIAMFLFFTLKITSSDPITSAKWFGAFTGFLVIYCGCLMPGAVTASEKSFDRIIQIVLAGVYVTFAYQFLSEIRSIFSKRNNVHSSEPA